MILKRKAISRKYNISLVRIKAISGWCSYCDYFNDSDDESRNKCVLEFLKTYPTISIYNICLKLIPEYIGSKLRNYVYVVPKIKED